MPTESQRRGLLALLLVFLAYIAIRVGGF